MNYSPLDDLPQNEWDALICSILRPFYYLYKNDILITQEDLQQEAWIGLLAACKRYDPSKAKFTTFAYHYIRGHVMRYIAKRTKDKLIQEDKNPIVLDVHTYEETECERRDIVETIMDRLSDQKHAHLLIEHFIRNKSLRHVAKEQGVSHEAIATRIHKLLEILEKRLNYENA